MNGTVFPTYPVRGRRHRPQPLPPLRGERRSFSHPPLEGRAARPLPSAFGGRGEAIFPKTGWRCTGSEKGLSSQPPDPLLNDGVYHLVPDPLAYMGLPSISKATIRRLNATSRNPGGAGRLIPSKTTKAAALLSFLTPSLALKAEGGRKWVLGGCRAIFYPLTAPIVSQPFKKST